MPVQALLLRLRGRGPEQFARLYWVGIRQVLGITVRVQGTLSGQRPVLFIANHCSWLDIVTLGSLLPACFVAKGDVATWPLIGLVARLGRTIFVSRNRTGVGRERNELKDRLVAGDNIILFPEGTTSDGTRILPFSTAFLALAEGKNAPWVQPVTLVYDAIDGLPVRRRDRPQISWYGEMSLAPHFAVIGRRRSLHATMILHEPIAPGTYGDRKALSAALEVILSAQAARLRQGRI